MMIRKFNLFMAWEHEKEEQWLAKMESQGLHFKKYRLLWYEFEQGEPNQYQYKLEMLPNLPSHPESKAYIEFMEDMGIEVVDSYIRWVYFRKKWDDAPFELYSDADHRIRHLRGIFAFLLPLLAILLINLTNMRHLLSGDAPIAAVPLLLIIAALVVGIIRGMIGIHKKIKQLEKERALHE